MKLLKLLFLFGIIGFSLSCKKSESPKSSEAKLIKVTCSFGNGVIDTVSNTVILKAPESTDITQIIPQLEVSKNAVIYPQSGVAVDFTNPVIYTITSEDKTTINVFKVIVLKPIVKFTVYDCSNWSPTSFQVPQANATIKIYTKAENVGSESIYETLTTDQNAQAVLYGLRTNNYYLTVSKDNKSNIVNGYILLGTYNNQVEVNNSFDTNAMVGGYKYYDLNGDGKLNINDKANYQTISGQYDLSGNNVLLKDLFIGN